MKVCGIHTRNRGEYMKKKSICFVLLFILCMVSCNDSYADIIGSGDPSVSVEIINPKTENYDVDLLVYHVDAESYYNVKQSYRDEPFTKLEEYLYDYNKDGYLAESLRDRDLWKWPRETSVSGNDLWIFSYHSVPNDFKVIIAYDDGTISVSDLMHRDKMIYHITLDASTMKYQISDGATFIRNNMIPIAIIGSISVIIICSAIVVIKRKKKTTPTEQKS